MRFGEALRNLPAGSYQLSTKIGRYLEPCEAGQEDAGIFVDVPHNRAVYDYSYDGVMRSYEESLKRMGLDSIDILYIHDVDIWTHGSKEASDRRIEEVMSGGYKAMEELRASGAIKAIGAGVNEWEVCQRLTEMGDFDCFLLAGRYTLLEQKALDSFLPICEARNIGIVLGGPYNSGILATGAIEGAVLQLSLCPTGNPGSGRRHRPGLRRPRRRHGQRGAAVPAGSPGGGIRDPRGHVARRSDAQHRHTGGGDPTGLLVRSQNREASTPRSPHAVRRSSAMIDAHVHLWKIARGDYGWMSPDLTAIYRDFDVTDLRERLASTGVAQAVLVQAAPTVRRERIPAGDRRGQRRNRRRRRLD